MSEPPTPPTDRAPLAEALAETSEQERREARLRAVTIGELAPLAGCIQIIAYDAAWPHLFAAEAVKIRAALGERALRVEHVGSTSVSGLAAKPLIDILLVVADTTDEPCYVPDLERAGYVLRIREPELDEHRMFKGADPAVNLHVYPRGCEEVDRCLLFRDWLREHEAERELYARTKRELAEREWKYMQDYADAKSEVVASIRACARSAVSLRREP
jgi:GrpB-like predicted nucleotidyltransferase (UPF0157 family)